MTYEVTLERGSDGTYLAWVDDLPGCAVRGSSREYVLNRLSAAIAEFLDWTGEPSADPPAVTVREEVESLIEAEEDTEVLVATDRYPLTEEDWDRIGRWLEKSRVDLDDLQRRLPDGALETKRSASRRTVGEEIEHVAFVELMYAMWTFDLRSREGLAEFSPGHATRAFDAWTSWRRRVAAARPGRRGPARRVPSRGPRGRLHAGFSGMSCFISEPFSDSSIRRAILAS